MGVVEQLHGVRISRDDARRVLVQSANVLLVAEEGGHLLGLAWAHWLDDLRFERRKLFVHELEVHPAQRRRGLGHGLLEQLLGRARSERADAFLVTQRDNVAAVGLYSPLGGQCRAAPDALFQFSAGAKDGPDA